MGLRFGSFGAASAPSRLWSDRVEAGDPSEQEAPPLSPPTSPTGRVAAVAASRVPLDGGASSLPRCGALGGAPRGGMPRQVASPPTSPGPGLASAEMGGRPRQVASPPPSPSPSPRQASVVRSPAHPVVASPVEPRAVSGGMSGRDVSLTRPGQGIQPVRRPDYRQVDGPRRDRFLRRKWWLFAGFQTRGPSTGV